MIGQINKGINANGVVVTTTLFMSIPLSQGSKQKEDVRIRLIAHLLLAVHIK